MLRNVQLSLLIGPGSPTAAPRGVLDALAEAEVHVDDTGSGGFQLTFSIDKKSQLQMLFLLTGGQQALFMRVVLVVTVNGVPTVLMDGVVTNNELAPGDKGSNSTLTITGKDLTALMDQSDQSGFPFPASPPEKRVEQILGKYSVFGVSAQVIPAMSSYAPSQNEQIPSQQGTDLEYILSLARLAGYVFYFDPGPAPGVSRAYWGPQMKTGLPQPALSADMDAYTNVETLNFSFDQEQNRKPIVYSNCGKDGPRSVPIPAPTALNPMLGQIPPAFANGSGGLVPFRDDLAKLPESQARMIGVAAASRYIEAVTCQGSLNVTRYGGVLKARELVGVRGSGPAFDGLYYVKSVTHNIRRGEYKQNFTLTRDGLGSTVSMVNT